MKILLYVQEGVDVVGTIRINWLTIARVSDVYIDELQVRTRVPKTKSKAKEPFANFGNGRRQQSKECGQLQKMGKKEDSLLEPLGRMQLCSHLNVKPM